MGRPSLWSKTKLKMAKTFTWMNVDLPLMPEKQSELSTALLVPSDSNEQQTHLPLQAIKKERKQALYLCSHSHIAEITRKSSIAVPSFQVGNDLVGPKVDNMNTFQKLAENILDEQLPISEKDSQQDRIKKMVWRKLLINEFCQKQADLRRKAVTPTDTTSPDSDNAINNGEKSPPLLLRNNESPNALSREDLISVSFLLYVESALHDYVLQQKLEQMLRLNLALMWRDHTAGHMNMLLNVTYLGRMSFVDLFFNAAFMNNFENWLGYHALIGNPGMILRGFFYLKGFLIGCHYFYHGGKVDYRIVCNMINDLGWFLANTANVIDNIVQIILALSHHKKYFEPLLHFHWIAKNMPWLEGVGIFSWLFTIMYLCFDLPRDLIRDLIGLFKVSHPFSKEWWRRFRIMWGNFFCNLGMGIARLGMSLPCVMAALAPILPWMILGIFVLGTGYCFWQLSKLDNVDSRELPKWIPIMAGLSLVVIAPLSLVGMILAPSAAVLAVSGAGFVLAAIMFGISTYYYLRLKGIDHGTSLRVGLMSAGLGLLLVGAAILIGMAAWPVGLAAAGVLSIITLGIIREAWYAIRVASNPSRETEQQETDLLSSKGEFAKMVDVEMQEWSQLEDPEQKAFERLLYKECGKDMKAAEFWASFSQGAMNDNAIDIEEEALKTDPSSALVADEASVLVIN